MRPSCERCGLDYAFIDSGDGPAVFIILIAGAIVVGAALVVEVLSPHDESWEKLDFYAAHGVDEVVMVDPQTRVVTWLMRESDGYVPTERSEVLGCTVAEFVGEIAFPEA